MVYSSPTSFLKQLGVTDNKQFILLAFAHPFTWWIQVLKQLQLSSSPLNQLLHHCQEELKSLDLGPSGYLNSIDGNHQSHC
jgi:hypothetical protein